MINYVTKFVPREQYNLLKDALEKIAKTADKWNSPECHIARKALLEAESMEIGPSK